MTPIDRTGETLREHYERPDLEGAVFAAIAAAGLDAGRLAPDDLAPLDEFHVRGVRATRELAAAAGITADMRVLDVGCGVGGPARRLAREIGCRVVGVDLFAEYCRVASRLAEGCGLSARVSFRPADALALPFPDGAFDVVWTQHAAMNVPDKAAFYREAARVLAPGGTLALHDVVDAGGGPVVFPVPWSRAPETSFLVPAAELGRLLTEAGFTIVDWVDGTSAAAEWFGRLLERAAAEEPPPLGLHVLLGPEFPAMVRNLHANLVDGRIAVARVVARKRTGLDGKETA